jgi:hypothetical protein
VFLTAKELNGKDIMNTLTRKLRADFEGRCIKAGYVMPDSTEIISRTLGLINNANFTSTIMFDVIFKTQVCNPGIGAELKCYVAEANKTQILAYIDNLTCTPMEIYLLKSHHVGNTDFTKLEDSNSGISNMGISSTSKSTSAITKKKKTKILVKILASNFNFKDTQIIAVAQLVKIL